MIKTLEEIREINRKKQAVFRARHRDEINAKARIRRTIKPDKPYPRKKRTEPLTPKQKEQGRIRNVRYRVKNRARIRAKSNLRNQGLRKEISAYSRAYRATNPEKRRETSRKYAATHKEVITVNAAKRRFRKKAAPINDFTVKQWREMKDHYKHLCVYCGKKQTKMTMDHITPLSKGGSHTRSNIVPSCLSCNLKKQSGPPPIPLQPMLL